MEIANGPPSPPMERHGDCNNPHRLIMHMKQSNQIQEGHRALVTSLIQMNQHSRYREDKDKYLEDQVIIEGPIPKSGSPELRGLRMWKQTPCYIRTRSREEFRSVNIGEAPR
jgi:hypothetical protein